MTPTKRWRMKNKLKVDAHWMVQAAVKKGLLTKGVCADCNSGEKIHAHHEDYTKPFDVVWLCSSCHQRRHTLERGYNVNNKVKKKPRDGCLKYQPAKKRFECFDDAVALHSRGLTYREIAEELCVSAASVFKWLNNPKYK